MCTCEMLIATSLNDPWQATKGSDRPLLPTEEDPSLWGMEEVSVHTWKREGVDISLINGSPVWRRRFQAWLLHLRQVEAVFCQVTQGMGSHIHTYTQGMGSHIHTYTQGMGSHIHTYTQGMGSHIHTYTQGMGSHIRTYTQGMGSHIYNCILYLYQ